MTDQEKVVWLKALVGCWSTLIAMPLTAGVTGPITDPDFPEFVTVWSWMFISFTAAYLLILSWRAAYLSGRKKR